MTFSRLDVHRRMRLKATDFLVNKIHKTDKRHTQRLTSSNALYLRKQVNASKKCKIITWGGRREGGQRRVFVNVASGLNFLGPPQQCTLLAKAGEKAKAEGLNFQGPPLQCEQKPCPMSIHSSVSCKNHPGIKRNKTEVLQHVHYIYINCSMWFCTVSPSESKNESGSKIESESQS